MEHEIEAHFATARRELHYALTSALEDFARKIGTYDMRAGCDPSFKATIDAVLSLADSKEEQHSDMFREAVRKHTETQAAKVVAARRNLLHP